MSVDFVVNGKPVSAHAAREMPLLWVARDRPGRTGAKLDCGAAPCGACTVHLDGAPVRSCQGTFGAVQGAEVTPIEAALSPVVPHPLQRRRG